MQIMLAKFFILLENLISSQLAKSFDFTVQRAP